MYFLVENCFHWIGFHIVSRLLDNGWQVDGMDDLDTDKKEHLSMFLGRNDLFHHVSSCERSSDYDARVSVGNRELVLQKPESITIKLPLIFGEWMPMNEEGIYTQNDFIRFDSEPFLSRAVHVADVFESLEQWIASSELPAILDVRSFHDRQTDNIKLENAVYIRNNRPINEQIKMVKKHYGRYKKFYPACNGQ
ncbi:MAG TPA: hypothetical protein VK097_10505 [Lentibacillus sp.]|uniref:hypothetical protein n=1 Tax=Lentibacillus sp. TaxID=1925746 RepID=UPI002B4B950F|nr:hypothetical protein [Lentibacillus sp.]HLR62860.1 hypothetical protein [Lentibacillus sp.]